MSDVDYDDLDGIEKKSNVLPRSDPSIKELELKFKKSTREIFQSPSFRISTNTEFIDIQQFVEFRDIVVRWLRRTLMMVTDFKSDFMILLYRSSKCDRLVKELLPESATICRYCEVSLTFRHLLSQSHITYYQLKRGLDPPHILAVIQHPALRGFLPDNSDKAPESSEEAFLFFFKQPNIDSLLRTEFFEFSGIYDREGFEIFTNLVLKYMGKFSKLLKRSCCSIEKLIYLYDKDLKTVELRNDIKELFPKFTCCKRCNKPTIKDPARHILSERHMRCGLQLGEVEKLVHFMRFLKKEGNIFIYTKPLRKNGGNFQLDNTTNDERMEIDSSINIIQRNNEASTEGTSNFGSNKDRESEKTRNDSWNFNISEKRISRASMINGGYNENQHFHIESNNDHRCNVEHEIQQHNLGVKREEPNCGLFNQVPNCNFDDVRADNVMINELHQRNHERNGESWVDRQNSKSDVFEHPRVKQEPMTNNHSECNTLISISETRYVQNSFTNTDNINLARFKQEPEEISVKVESTINNIEKHNGRFSSDFVANENSTSNTSSSADSNDESEYNHYNGYKHNENETIYINQRSSPGDKAHITPNFDVNDGIKNSINDSNSSKKKRKRKGLNENVEIPDCTKCDYPVTRKRLRKRNFNGECQLCYKLSRRRKIAMVKSVNFYFNVTPNTCDYASLLGYGNHVVQNDINDQCFNVENATGQNPYNQNIRKPDYQLNNSYQDSSFPCNEVVENHYAHHNDQDNIIYDEDNFIPVVNEPLPKRFFFL